MFRMILLRILENFFRRPLLYILPILLATAAGAAYVYFQDPTYIANGGMAVQESNTTQDTLGIDGTEYIWQTPSEVTVDQLEELFESNSIIRSILSQTELESELADPETDIDDLYKEVRNDLWVQPLGDYHFLISGKSEDPLVAQQLVAATIQTFLNWNSSIGLADASASVEFFQEQLIKETAEFEAAQEAHRQFLIDYPEPIRGDRTDLEELDLERLSELREDASKRLTDTRDNLDFAQLSYKLAETEVAQKYLIIDPPDLPEESEFSLSTAGLTMVLFMLGGIVLGLLMLLFNSLLDRTYRFPVDVRLGLRVPTLGGVPVGLATPQRRASRRQPALPKPAMALPAQSPGFSPTIDPPTMVIENIDRELMKSLARQRADANQFHANGTAG